MWTKNFTPWNHEVIILSGTIKEQRTPNKEQTNTMADIQLYTKISGLPANLKVEVEDFIDFLLNKKRKNVSHT